LILDTISDLCRSKKNLFLPPAKLRHLQFRKLKAILVHADETISFYHRKFERAGVKPGEFRSVDDLRKIPITTRQEIQSTSLRDMIPQGFNSNNVVKSRTSGSTGYPLVVLSSRRIAINNSSIWLRAELQNGLRLWDKKLSIMEPEHFSKKGLSEYLGINRKVYSSIFADPAHQTASLLRARPDVIQGFPSSLAFLGRFIKERGLNVNPRLIFTVAEFLYDEDRKSIEEVFGGELFDYYGSTEIGLIAWECRAHGAYHINADNVMVDFVDSSGDSVSSEERGEIICTGLNNYVMPLIRYDQGDLGAAVHGKCSCGLKLPLMQLQGGRRDDFLRAINGRYISPNVFFPFPFDRVDNILQFRVVQEERDRILIQLVVKERYDPPSLRKAERRVKQLFGEDMNVSFSFLKKIHREKSGKLRKVVSRLPRVNHTR
jgi:phenylacetate-CoA ligase